MDGGDDLRHGLAIGPAPPTRCANATVVAYAYILGNTDGRAALRRFRVARDRGCPNGLPNDPVTTSPVALTRATLGVALVHRRHGGKSVTAGQNS